MKVKTGLHVGMLVTLMGVVGCYPKTCKPSDTSCWSCENPANTNPACPPFPSDSKRPDAGDPR